MTQMTDRTALKTSDFDYFLDEALVAQKPAQRRDQARLMVLNRRDGQVSHRVFADLVDLLRDDDLLVVNDTRVIPARFVCHRRSGGKVEGLFCRERAVGQWEVMLRNARRCKVGEALVLAGGDGVSLVLRENQGKGGWLVEPDGPGSAEEILQRAGITPLPPYIHRRGDHRDDAEDRLRYQTVYAARAGAAAAPTAGLHFTHDLLDALAAKGVRTARVTLHVGPGTFAPVTADHVTDHEMHSEWYQLSDETARAITAARAASRRVVAVGTTSVRVLETAARRAGPLAACTGQTDIFIHPPAEFRLVDALITNFHLPCSTLLMLVAAFCSPGATDGVARILSAYRQAVESKYRFYSYGDAMLIE